MKYFFLLLFLLTIAFSAINDTNPTSNTPTSVEDTQLETDDTFLDRTSEAENNDTTGTTPLYEVVRVVDGDTIEVLIDGRKKTVRYIGIDTPETVHPSKPVECFGVEASNKNKELVVGKKVRLAKDVSETDKYGRLLRYVYVDDTFVNLTLVQEGYANALSYPPDVAFNEEFRKAEQEAREDRRGLWGSACASATPKNPSEISQITSPTPFVLATQDTSKGQCTIKGNINSEGEKIYHTIGCGSYSKTRISEGVGERWFCTESEALDAGWRKALNC